MPSVDLEPTGPAQEPESTSETPQPSEDIARDIVEPSESQEQPDEFSWAPMSRKKSKKDKKKRQQSLLADKLGSTFREDPSTAREQVEPDPVAESAGIPEPDQPAFEPSITKELPAVPEPINEPVQEEPQESWAPTTKKGKKDKKKRKSQAWTEEPQVEAPSTTMEPEPESVNLPVVDPVVEHAQSA